MKNKSLILLFALFVFTSSSSAQQKLVSDICKIKGQEQNELRGVGLVVGLNGTGDPDQEMTASSLAQMLANSGMEVPKDAYGREITEIYREAKNVALVFVTASVPSSGARQGSKITCQVHTLGNASSLKGGFLMETALTGGPSNGQPSQLPVLATASGKIHLEDPTHVTSGKIHNGAQLQVDFYHRFFEETTEYVTDQGTSGQTGAVKKRYLNLVIDKNHASFATAMEIADQINATISPDEALDPKKNPHEYAKPIDQINIRVEISPPYYNRPVEFASLVLNDTVIHSNQKNAVVIINQKTGTVTVGDDVYFRPAAISSGDFAIEAGAFRAVALKPDQLVTPEPVKLQQLVQALNQIQAPSTTVIDVIRQLNAGGLLFGKLIEEY